MALTKADVFLWDHLRKAGLLPASPTVLEIGQANWYGDAPLPDGCPETEPFAIARWYYQQTLAPSRMVAIDMSGTEAALRLDLNEPVGLSKMFDATDGGNLFDITINTGTAEHVFNQAQLFRTIHDWTKPGGLMVHAAPVGAGWFDHGLYTYSPELFNLLAEANSYQFLAAFYFDIDTAEIGTDLSFQARTMAYMALRKTKDEPFRYPMQTRLAAPRRVHFYDRIPGWFTRADGHVQAYHEAVRAAPSPAVFVEVGVWEGRSTAFLAVEIANSGKAIALHCVDNFATPNNDQMSRILSKQGGSVLESFQKNLIGSPVPLTVHRGDSVRVAESFADGSIDWCFIDASHDYESVRADIQAWSPKIKRGGVLAGHDYDADTDPGVVRAVGELLPGHVVSGRCWKVRV